MASQEEGTSTGLDSLPTEVLIDIVSDVTYSPAMRNTLRLVDHRFKHVVDSYEHSIAAKMLTTQFPWAPRQFPNMLGKAAAQKNSPGWNELATIHRRVAVLANIKARCKIFRDAHSETEAFTTCRALIFHHTGLLLLYRLADCASRAEKVALIRSLPVASLAVLKFTLMVSYHMIQAMGPSPAIFLEVLSIPAMNAEAHSDIALAAEERLLRHGPDFLLGLMNQDPNYIELWIEEVRNMDEFERKVLGPDESPADLITLYAHLGQAFAAAVKCEQRYNLVHMWYVLDEQCSSLTDGREDVVNRAVERVVNGEPMEVRCSRCKMLQLYGF